VPLDVEENAAPSVVTADAADVFKQKLMRRIELEETAVRQAESAHATNLELSKSYTRSVSRTRLRHSGNALRL